MQLAGNNCGQCVSVLQMLMQYHVHRLVMVPIWTCMHQTGRRWQAWAVCAHMGGPTMCGRL